MPKVSVIVPVYGVEKYIERCVRSLFEQTLDEIEYLFIDDCTPDKSIDILKTVLNEYSSRKGQVIIHQMEQNSGQAAARKWGMLNATGDYVIHCDSDDWVDTDAYRLLYESAVTNNADIVTCDYCITNCKTSKIVSNHYVGNSEGFLKVLMTRHIWSLCIKMVRRKIYTDNPIIYPADNMGEDMALSFQLAYYSNVISAIERPLYYYFQHSESITHIVDRNLAYERFHQAINNTNLVLDFLKNHGLLTKYKTELVCYKQFERNQCIMLIDDQSIRKEWLSTFPEINTQVFLSRYFTLRYKIKYMLAILGLRTKNVSL